MWTARENGRYSLDLLKIFAQLGTAMENNGWGGFIVEGELLRLWTEMRQNLFHVAWNQVVIPEAQGNFPF